MAAAFHRTKSGWALGSPVAVWACVVAAGLSGPASSDAADWSPMTSGTTDVLYGVWGTGSSNVFAVGPRWSILRYDGSGWSTMAGAIGNRMRAVWGSGANDVFAVGDVGMILHFNGSAWTPMTSGVTDFLRGVWGSGSTDVFAVGFTSGGGGRILHYNGTNWSAIARAEPLEGVWGTGPSNVLAVGSGPVIGGVILRFDGTNWSVMASTSDTLKAVWGTGPSNVFAAGANGTILHYTGGAWSSMSTGTTELLMAVWGSGPNDIFAVGANGTVLHYDGASWSPTSSGTTEWVNDVWGSSSNDVFAVGGSGTILHYPMRYDLTVQTTGQGDVQPDDGTYDAGTPLTLTANAGTGWVFDHWEGALTGSANPAALTMDADKTVTAVFVEPPLQYTLAVTVQGQGDVKPTGGTYTDGTPVTLTATAHAGWAFHHWEAALTGSTNPAEVTMDSDKTVTAVFFEITPQYTLTVNVQGQGEVKPNGGTYDLDTPVTLTATASDGWRFDAWQGDLAGPNNPASIVMNGDKVVTVVFVETTLDDPGPNDPNGAASSSSCCATQGGLTLPLVGVTLAMLGLRRRIRRPGSQ